MSSEDIPQSPSLRGRISFILIALAIFAIGAALGDGDRAVVAALSFAAIGIAVQSRWDLRHRAWFWGLISAFVVAHLAAVVLIGWQIDVHPTILLAPVVIADFVAMVGLIFAA